MTNSIVFLATFPQIQSAIKITGGGDGMRIQLDIPETEMGNAIELLTLRGQIVKVTIEPEKQKETEEDATLQTRTKRKSEWKTD